MSEATVESMQVYYAQRAAIYERIYQKPERQSDLLAMQAWLPSQFTGRRVLEIACGTGWWTQFGARGCTRWWATDVNPETLAIARMKALPPGKVEFATVDAYLLDGLDQAGFDAAFAGFWWSHVPLARLSPWLALLHRKLDRGARVVMLDNRYVEGSSTPITRRDAQGNGYQQRRLGDGSMHEVLKNFPSRGEAIAALGPDVRDAQWHAWTHYWALTYTLA